MIPRSRRSLFKDQSFGGSDNAGNTSNLEWACKGRELGGGKGRHTGIGVHTNCEVLMEGRRSRERCDDVWCLINCEK